MLNVTSPVCAHPVIDCVAPDGLLCKQLVLLYCVDVYLIKLIVYTLSEDDILRRELRERSFHT